MKPESALREVSSSPITFEMDAVLQRSRVAKSLSEFTSDTVLGLKIDLLEQLWGDGQAARGSDAVQCMFRIHVLVEMTVVFLPTR